LVTVAGCGCASLAFLGERKAAGRIFDIGRDAMLKMLQRTHPELTVHGFRSSFTDWAGDCTDTPRDLAQACLAHTIGNEVERAYRRTDWLAKRRDILTQWAAYCTGGS
jgi:integrase